MENLHSLIESTIAALVVFVNKVGYLGIFIGMFLESTVIPIPSELVMIPAGLAAANGDMNLFLVTFYGVLGNVFGAIFSYYVSMSLGRAVLFRVGKYFFLKPENIVRMESFFKSHGEISVFIARLIPGARHFISIPAGVAKMNISKFIFYTTLGSAIWTSTLSIIGYLVGKNQDLIHEYLSTIIISCVAFAVLLIIGYIYFKKRFSVLNSKIA